MAETIKRKVKIMIKISDTEYFSKLNYQRLIQYYFNNTLPKREPL